MVDKSLRVIGKVVTWIAAIALFVIAILTVVDVLARAFWRPIFGTTEVSSYVMLITACCAIVFTQIEKAHVTIGIFTERLPKRVNKFLFSAGLLLSLGIVLAISWRAFLSGWSDQLRGAFTPILSIPMFPFKYFLAVCFLILFLVMVIHFVKSFTEDTK